MDEEIERIKREKMARLMNEDIPTVGNFPHAGVTELNDQTFGDFVKQQSIVVIDCWAAWCGPCRTMEPVMEQLAQEYAGKVSIGKLNVDHNPQTAMRYGVSSIPNFLVFQNGKYLGNVVGAVGKKPFQQLFKKILSGDLDKKEGYA